MSHVFELLADSQRSTSALLHGVTGSGKTEVYLRLAAAVRAGGRRVLMLVPEIALTPAVASLFRQAFGERVAIQHSGLSDGERHDQWQRIRRGDIDVVVGTRSAVFAPLDATRPHHRRRGARRLVQAGGEPALQRPRRRDRPRAAGRRAGRARVGDAVDGELPQRDDRAGTSASCSSAACSIGRWPSVRVVDMREEYAAEGPDVDPEPGAREAIAAAARAARAGAGAAEPPRLRDGGVLPAVRRHARVSELQRVARRARRGHRAARALPLLQLLVARAAGVSAVRRPVSRAGRLRHRARRSGGRERVPGRARRAARSRRHPPQGIARRRSCRGFATARSTCSSARR